MTALRNREMVDKTSLSGFIDREENIGVRFINECDKAVPVSWNRWVPPKHRRPPRGKSVNPGHKEIYNE